MRKTARGRLQLFPTAWVYGMIDHAYRYTYRWPSGRHLVERPSTSACSRKGRGRGEAVFNLHCPGGPPELRGSYGFRLVDLNRIENALMMEIAVLCAEWSRIHGDY